MAIIKIRNAAIDLDAAEIPNLPATKITSGTLDNARISLDAAEIPNLNTAKITTGTLADARLPANALNSNVDLTTLSASNLTSGTLPNARFGTPTFNGSNITNLPASGITMADQWRYTGGVAFASTTVVINADWERSDTNAQGGLGTGMSQSSGIFTFPSTGIYSVSFHFNAYRVGESRYVFSEIQSTQNNSTYVTISQSYTHIKQADSSATYCNADANTLLDVTDTSNVKVRFRIRSVNEATLQGGTDENRTFATFIRLGDT